MKTSTMEKIQEWLRQCENGAWARDGADIGIIEAEELLREILSGKDNKTAPGAFLDSIDNDAM